MIVFLLVLDIIIAVALVISILLQAGRGGGMAAAIGGPIAGTSVFGGRGAGDFLTKTTTGLAIAFAVLTILINLISSKGTVRQTRSVIPAEAGKEAPAQPAGGGMPQTPMPEDEGY